MRFETQTDRSRRGLSVKMRNLDFWLYPKSTEMPLESFKLEDMFQVIVQKDHSGSNESIRGQ